MKNKLTKFCKINKMFFLTFILLLLIIFLFLNCNNISQDIKKEDINNFNFFELPIELFSRDNLIHGSVYNNDYSNFKLASFNEMSYHSYPTSTVTLLNEDYKNISQSLKSEKSWDEITEINKNCGENNDEDCGYLKQMYENFNEFPDFAPYYLPTYSINVKKFDLDGDGIKEIIIYSCGIGGNHCPHKVDIIKNDSIIFSSSLIGAQIYPTDSNNGFYLDWYSEDNLSNGYCCPSGHIRTRFIFENNKFIPILEQEVYYLMINNLEDNSK